MPSPWYPGGRGGRLRQMGYRYPKFLGGRKSSANQICSLAAIPIFAGESLTKLEMVVTINSDGDLNPDEVQQHEIMVAAVPFLWGDPNNGNNLDANSVDALIETVVHQPDGYEFGARPNPGGDNDWMGTLETTGQGAEMLYEYSQFLLPIASGIDGSLTPPDRSVVRMGAVHRKTIEKNHYFGEDHIVIVASARSAINAQTDFGVAELDGTSATEDQILGALTTASAGDITSLTAQADKLHELIYGGDQYIEADTLGNSATRAAAMVKTQIATPWPRFATQ